MKNREMNETTGPATAKGPDAESGSTRSEAVVPGYRRRWIIASLVLFVLVILLLASLEDTIDVTETSAPLPLQVVSVETVKTSPQVAEVRAFAEVRPRWSAQLSAATSGRIVQVFNSALAGEPIEKDTPLIEIEKSRYAAELANAQLELKQAELALWQAENAALVARREFKRTGQEPPNDLALKLPQLDIAQSAVVSAKARVFAAERQLNDTTVVAPFSAFVTERFVSPGQTVSVGDPLLTLADNTQFEIVVELGRKDYALLRQPLAGQAADVLQQDGQVIAQAKVRSGGGFLDNETRQYKIFLDVDHREANAVLSGDFVTMRLRGIPIDKALAIPASALTQEGYVWHVDQDNRLQRFTPAILFRRQDRVIIRAPSDKNEWHIAVTPLFSFLPGQEVEQRIWEN